MVAQLVDTRNCLLCRDVPFPGGGRSGVRILGPGHYFYVFLSRNLAKYSLALDIFIYALCTIILLETLEARCRIFD